METFTAGAMIRYGWETFKKRPWFFIGAYVVAYVASIIPQQIISAMQPASAASSVSFGILAFVVAILVNTLYSMGVTAFSLKANDDVTLVRFGDLWHPAHFLAFLGTCILVFLATLVGFILLIVPGIIVALMIQFAAYAVIDAGLSPLAAISESRRITKGKLGTLFLLLLSIIGINILGAVALLVGLLVSLPVSMLAMAHAYRTLKDSAAA